MVGIIGSTNNLINMISLSYQQGSEAVQETTEPVKSLPPATERSSESSTEAPLGVLSTVDLDSDSYISIDEYYVLTKCIREVTGYALDSTFVDFDEDGDGRLNISELRSVLDESGFTPPPPHPDKVIAAYDAQSGEEAIFQAENENMLEQLLEYLESRSEDVDILAWK